MSMLSFERRRSNPKAIYAACMIGLSIGIPVLIVLPKIIEAREASKPRISTACHYYGSDASEMWRITEDKGDSYVIVPIKNDKEGALTVPKEDVQVSQSTIPDEYRWFSIFHSP